MGSVRDGLKPIDDFAKRFTLHITANAHIDATWLWRKKKTIEVVHKNGFFEYFDPISGKGHGADNFSWTAALIIDLVAQYLIMPKG